MRPAIQLLVRPAASSVATVAACAAFAAAQRALDVNADTPAAGNDVTPDAASLTQSASAPS